VFKVYRFRDLKEAGIVKNWVTLKRWIEKHGFPPGRLLGPNTRVWTEAEIEAWFLSRPEGWEGPPPEIAKPAAPVGAGSDGPVSKEDRLHPSTASESESQASEKSEAA
jgi:hypothetical protein